MAIGGLRIDFLSIMVVRCLYVALHLKIFAHVQRMDVRGSGQESENLDGDHPLADGCKSAKRLEQT